MYPFWRVASYVMLLVRVVTVQNASDSVSGKSNE